MFFYYTQNTYYFLKDTANQSAKMKYEKGDVDVNGMYILNKSAKFHTKSPFYTELALIKKNNNEYFRAYMLQNICNPTQPIKDSFIYITTSDNENYCKSPLFVIFLLHIVKLEQFSLCDRATLERQIFGSQKHHKCSKNEKQCLDYVLNNKQKFQKEDLLNLSRSAKEDIQSKFKQKWTSIKFESHQDQQRALWHAKYTLFWLIKWSLSETKRKKLQQLSGSLSSYQIQISEYRRIMQSQKKYDSQILVIVPEKKQYVITWKQIQLNFTLKLLHSGNIQQISYKLYKALRQFQNRFKFPYPCLSLNNIMVQTDTNNVHLDILPMLYYRMGVPDNILTFNDLQDCRDFQFTFWFSPDRISRIRNKSAASKFDNISGSDCLWEFIFLIDYLEKGSKSYFKAAPTLANLQQRQSALQHILKGGNQQEVFGKHTSEILSFLMTQKQITSWKQMRNQNIDIKALEQLYKTKFQNKF